ncbi:urease, beta subunit [Candidatus Nitrososphaera evergladensis SR1]|jgi:urease subunit beta|uniref:Urease, beta subunit n=2 Tax=Nitrososphaera TaxID=497726 RepID=A0A075N0A7_9ARCH|nr:urease, beta subunit [Candidatus Nitrososphaera evergladensis SR1]
MVKKNGKTTKKRKAASQQQRVSKKEEVTSSPMMPGEYILAPDPVMCNTNRKTVKITVKNKGDRPCQIGSHTHFFEVNRALDFPREKAFGYRLNIPAGTSIRFEPGDSKDVELCEIGGARVCYGFNGLTMGSLNSSMVMRAAVEKAQKQGFNGA